MSVGVGAVFYIDYVIGAEDKPVYLIKSFWFMTLQNRTEAMDDLALKLNLHEKQLNAIGYEDYESPYSTHGFETYGPTSWGMAVKINRINYTKEDIKQLFNKLGVHPQAPWYMSPFLIPLRTPFSFLLSGAYNLYRRFISDEYFNSKENDHDVHLDVSEPYNVSANAFNQTRYQPDNPSNLRDEYQTDSVIYRSKGFYDSQSVTENKCHELADILNINVKLIADVEPTALGQGYLIRAKSLAAAKIIEESVRKALNTHTQNELRDSIRFLNNKSSPSNIPTAQVEIWGAGATALSELINSARRVVLA